MKPIESFRGLKESLLSLEPGKSAGSGGMKPEFLAALGEQLSESGLELLEQFGLAYTAGELLQRTASASGPLSITVLQTTRVGSLSHPHTWPHPHRQMR